MNHEKIKTFRVGCTLAVIFLLFCALALMPRPVALGQTGPSFSVTTVNPTEPVAGTYFYDSATLTGTTGSTLDYVTYWLYSGTPPGTTPNPPPYPASTSSTNPYPSGDSLGYGAVYYTDGGTVPNSPDFSVPTAG